MTFLILSDFLRFLFLRPRVSFVLAGLLVTAGGLVSGLSAASARAADVDVYVLAGQSNMDGRAHVADLVSEDLPEAKPRPDIALWYRNPAGEGYATGWVDLAPGYSVSPKFAKKGGTLPSDTFGLELSFGPAMAAHRPGRHVALIKVSKGGTNLRHDWDPTREDADALYPLLIQNIEDAMKALAERGDTGHLRAVLWHQGEGDRKFKAYAEKLEDFIAKLRSDLERPELPFVIGEVFDNGKRDLVRNAQREVADKVPATAFVSSEGLETYEGTHFVSKSALEFGERFAVAVQGLTDDTVTPHPDLR